MEVFRYFTAMRPRLVDEDPVTRDGETFLRDFRFNSFTDTDDKGFNPILCAALSEDAPMVSLLVESRADVNHKLTSAIPDLYISKASTVLSVVVSFNCRPSAMISIIDARADIHARDAINSSIIGCSIYNHVYDPGLHGQARMIHLSFRTLIPPLPRRLIF